jgi:thymidylate synthase
MAPLNCYIDGQNLNEVWYKGLNLILKNGSVVLDRERNTTVYEVLNLSAYIRNVGVTYPEEIRSKLLHNYKNSLLKKENNGFIYTYGERLNNWDNKYDQIESIIKRIDKSRNTRRAVAATWIPSIDGERNEVPCMLSIDFKLRKKLYLTAYFRSNDFYGAFPYNIISLSVLQDYVANKLNVDSDGITLFSSSSHIYEFDKDAVIDILKKHRYLIGK